MSRPGIYEWIADAATTIETLPEVYRYFRSGVRPRDDEMLMIQKGFLKGNFSLF